MTTIDPKYDTLLAEMGELIQQRDAIIARDKDILKRSFANDEFSFKDLQTEGIAIMFQMMLCSDLILERAGRSNMPVSFLQHLVEELPSYYVAWSAQEAAKQAAEQMQKANEAPGPPVELTDAPAPDDDWSAFMDPDLPVN